MKSKDLAKYATDEQEKEQLTVKGRSKSGSESVSPKIPTFEATGGKDPLTLNKRKGKTY